MIGTASDRVLPPAARCPGDVAEAERELRSKLELQHEVLEQRAQELRREARKQARQRAFLREERKKARDEKEAIASDRAALKHRTKTDWFPKEYLPSNGKRLRINVGGQIFEFHASFVKHDPDSLLAALAADDCPLYDGSHRIPYVDRDWWTFRYVLSFLRDAVLPTSRTLVLQLYREATFWRLSTLRRAIEETHLNLTRTTIQIDADAQSQTYGLLKETTVAKKDKFWLNKPNWWEAQPPPKPEKKDKPPDWWRSLDDWQGKRMGPLSTDPEKVVADKSDVKAKKNVYPMVASTWGYYY